MQIIRVFGGVGQQNRHDFPFDFLVDAAVLHTSGQQLAGRLVADAEAGTGCEHACRDVHGEKFLEEQFGGVGDVDLGDAGLVVAGATLVFALLELTVTMSVLRFMGDEV